MAQRTLVAIITTCFMCLSLSTAWAKPTLKQPDVLTLDDEQSYAEVPVEAIQSFVQIYGIVKDNYVAEKK